MQWLLRLFAISMMLWAAPAHAQRVALVIGESAYRTVSPLANPGADANLVAAALARAGFDVRLGLDLDKAGLEAAIDDFAHDAQQADVAAVYYAGHGFEAAGRNWIVPVDAAISGPADLARVAVPFEAVARSLAGARVKIVALDACRDNPFAARVNEGSTIHRGLAEVELDGFVIVYAAAAGYTAADGVGNSPFAQSFARWIGEPNVDLRLLAGRIRDNVLASTNGQQRPFVSASLTGEATVLAPVPAGRVRNAATTWQRPSSYFEFVRTIRDPACFQTSEVRYATKQFALGGDRMVTVEDDNKLRVWDATGATLLRTETLPAFEGSAFTFAGKAMMFSGAEKERIGVHTPMDVVPLNGRRTSGSIEHGSDEPVLQAVTGSPPVAIFSYDWCTIGMFDLRTFKSIGEAYWPARCGGGITVNWLFGERDSDRVIASVKKGDEWAVLLMSARTARIVCQVPGQSPDAALNEIGRFNVANMTGGVDAYDGQCRKLRTDRLHSEGIKGVYPFDATRMMSHSIAGVVKVWSAAGGTVERELTGLSRRAAIQHVLSDRGAVLILNEDKHLYVWTGEPRLGTYVGPSAPVCFGQMSEDTNTLYALKCDGALEVWRRR